MKKNEVRTKGTVLVKSYGNGVENSYVVLIVLSLILSPLVVSGDGFLDDDLSYSFEAGSTTRVYVSGLKNVSATHISIPSTVKYEYTEYDDEGLSRIKHRTCSVKSIANSAFYWRTGIEQVTIPSSVTAIGSYAFSGCTGLRYVSIPDSVASIGNSAFNGCTNLVGVVIPVSVTSIGNYAFNSCKSLTEVTIPGGVSYVGDSAFSFCSGLSDVTIDEGVRSVGNNAFSSCGALMHVSLPESLTYIGDYAFYYTGLTRMTIPDGVTYVGSSAFSGCVRLGEITLPSSLTSIKGNTFANCYSLTTMTIPASVTNIESSAFYTCSQAGVFKFCGLPPNAYYAFSSVKQGARGYYLPENREAWEAVIDSRGYWQGLLMEPGFTIRYDANNGSGCVTDFIGLVGSSYTVEDVGELEFTWKAHCFQGWAFAPDGEVAYRAGESIDAPTDILTLYGVWATPTLTLAAESADWANGWITLRCTDADTSGRAHRYTLFYYDAKAEVWSIVDSARNVQADANGDILLTDTAFASRLDGIPPVNYCVMDENDRVSAECVTRNRYGIYVGIDVYENNGTDTPERLERCVEDADNIRNAFSDYGECISNHPLLNSDARKQRILDKIDELANVVNIGDILLLYYSSHGNREILACHGRNETITANELAFHLHFFPHGLGLVVMLDACLSGSMIERSGTASSTLSARGGTLPEATASANFAQDFAEQVSQCLDSLCAAENAAATGLRARSTSTSQNPGISSSEIGWITSSQSDQTSLDGVFTTECIYKRGWVKGGADTQEKGFVTFGDLGAWGSFWMQRSWYRYRRTPSVANGLVLNGIVAGRVPDHPPVVRLVAGPSTLTAIPGQPGQIMLSWTAVDGARRYEIYRKLKSEQFDEYRYIGKTDDTKCRDGVTSALNPNVEYEYEVLAVNDVYVSGASPSASCAPAANVALHDYALTTANVSPWSYSERPLVENGGVNYSNLNYDHDGDGFTTFQEYVTGSDPADKTSSFKGEIIMTNGVPYVTWSPNLNTNGVVRNYTVWGKTNLTEEAWHTPTNSASRFFKVTVEMP